MGALDCVTVEGMKSVDSTEVFTISNSTLNEPRRDLESQFSKSNTSSSKHSIWWTFAVDVPLIVIVLILLGLFELGVLPNHKSGFFCNDPALSFPFNGDTVSMGAIVSTVLIIPPIVIAITELVFLDPDYLQRSLPHQAIRNTLWLCRSYLYGMFFNLGIVEVLKGISGSPRPTFFDICEPDTAKTCNGSEYVSTFTCTSERFSSWFQSDSYHSFPSGHTSLSIYCALFVAWYLQRRAFNWTHRTVFLVPVIQFTLATYAAISSLTRITDHRHHWWDVLAGTFIGVLSTLYAVFVLCNNFSYVNSQPSCDVSIEEGQQSRTYLLERQRQARDTNLY